MSRTITTAYHLLDARNWASVQQHGLLSTQRLMEISGADDTAPRRHRTSGEQLACGAYIRDQRPMPPSALRRCLRDGLHPEDWFALLNSKVFFWLEPERLNRQRRACGATAQMVLVVDSERLLATCEAAATVTPINTGNAMRAAAARNLTTFVPYARWRADGWAHEDIAGSRRRPASHRPVELAIAGGIPDMLEFLVAAVPLAAGESFAPPVWPAAVSFPQGGR